MIQIRHFTRTNVDSTSYVYLFIRLFIAAFTPFYFFLIRRKFSINSLSPGNMGIYTSQNHYRAICNTETVCINSFVQIKIGDEKLNKQHFLLDSLVSSSILHRHVLLTIYFFRLLASTPSKFRKRLALLPNIIIYKYVSCLLERLPAKPTCVYIADSYSPRMLAAINYFNEICVPTVMIQHGLIQDEKRYRSNAKTYMFWSNFEYLKVKKYLRSTTNIVFFKRKYIVDNTSFLQENKCLIVLSPIQGMGKPYSQTIITKLKLLAENHSIYVRAHPSDNVKMFLSAIKMNTIYLSNQTWEEDLNTYSHFIIFNSSCVLDIIDSKKKFATFAHTELQYSLPKIEWNQAVQDINTLSDYVDFTTS